MTYICELCSEQFETRPPYTAHKKAHMRGEIPERSVEELVGGEEPQSIVAEPIVDYVDTTPKQGAIWNKEMVDVQPNRDTKSEPPKPKPLDLQYHYEGNCQYCNSEVETLVLDDVITWNKKPVKSKVAVIAWCPSCKKQLRQRQVAKL